MNFTRYIPLATASLVLWCAACAHTPSGTSVEVALAKKPELVKLPAPPPPLPVTVANQVPSANTPAVEPPLPGDNTTIERVGDAYSRGMFCLHAGRDEEAILAFEEAVKSDPTFADAWQNLALLYEKLGQGKKAMDAFKRAKKIARQ